MKEKDQMKLYLDITAKVAEIESIKMLVLAMKTQNDANSLMRKKPAYGRTKIFEQSEKMAAIAKDLKEMSRQWDEEELEETSNIEIVVPEDFKKAANCQ